MATVYKKRSPNRPVYISTGHPIVFEDLGMGYGYYTTSDGTVIAEFEKLMSEHRGGVELSSADEYADALKKKPSLPISNGSLIREQQTSGLIVPDLVSLAEFVEEKAANPNRPITVGVNGGSMFDSRASAVTPGETPVPRVGRPKPRATIEPIVPPKAPAPVAMAATIK